MKEGDKRRDDAIAGEREREGQRCRARERKYAAKSAAEELLETKTYVPPERATVLNERIRKTLRLTRRTCRRDLEKNCTRNYNAVRTISGGGTGGNHTVHVGSDSPSGPRAAERRFQPGCMNEVRSRTGAGRRRLWGYHRRRRLTAQDAISWQQRHIIRSWRV